VRDTISEIREEREKSVKMCLYIDHKSAIESDKGILKKHFNTIFPAATLPQLTDDICVIYISKLFLLLLMCVWLQLQPVSFNITPLKTPDSKYYTILLHQPTFETVVSPVFPFFLQIKLLNFVTLHPVLSRSLVF